MTLKPVVEEGAMASLTEVLRDILERELRPRVRAIDVDGEYPLPVLREMGKAGLFENPGLTRRRWYEHHLRLIEETAVVCGTTAFALWCHLAALTYVREGESPYLRDQVLPRLERGAAVGGTGLSNPMKFYAGMEPLRLRATAEGDGYRIDGTLPFVSNLGKGHWFGIVAQTDEGRRIVAFVPCDTEGLYLTERRCFMGLNGTATYQCRFDGVRIPTDYVLSQDADTFVREVRPIFVLSQCGMVFGLVRSAVEAMRGTLGKQGGANRYLRIQPEELEDRLIDLRRRAYGLFDEPWEDPGFFQNVLRIRLEGAYLALTAAEAGLLHSGAAGYVRGSDPCRRLREAYFVALVTPAVKQLEKMLQAEGDRR
ncbi:MAG: acyl-CoA dehydrogenase family protein [Alicyclobacillaceae bacterium]|nr:acyl-CoA dehydrogenase family protein [Alicyclobacillaceae bacterium]